MGLEVEFEAVGAGARAVEAGEGDDEVLFVGVVGALGDVECEWDVRGAAGFRTRFPIAVGGRAHAFCLAACQIVEVWNCEVDCEVGEGGVQLEGGGGLEGRALVGVGACYEVEECGEDGKSGGVEEMHSQG